MKEKDPWVRTITEGYISLLEAEKAEKPRWDRYDSQRQWGPSDPMWRLWDSVEMLDITLTYTKLLKCKAGKKRKKELKEELGNVYSLVDEAISNLDPWSWQGSRRQFRGLTNNVENLKAALYKLQKAKEIFEEIYSRVNVEVEASKQDAWLVTTPSIWSHLNNAIYGIQKFTELLARKACVQMCVRTGIRR